MSSNNTSEQASTTGDSYQITICGKLSEQWSEWFGGTIKAGTDKEGKPTTILSCQVRDQSELFGILNRLNSLNMQLLQVTIISQEGEDHV